MQNRKWLPMAIVGGYAVALFIASIVIIRWDLSYSLLMFSIIPVVLSSARPPRWVHFAMLALQAGALFWVVHTVVPNPISMYLSMAAGILTTYLTTTLLYQLQMRRRHAETRYLALVAQAFEGILILQDEKIVFANQTLADITGYSVAELLTFADEDVWSVIHPEDRAWVRTRHRNRNQGLREPHLYQARWVHRDGQTLWVEINIYPILYHGRACWQVVVRDVTEQRTVRAALQQRSQHLMLINRLVALTASSLDRVYVLQVLCDELLKSLEICAVSAVLVNVEQTDMTVVAEAHIFGYPSVLGNTMSTAEQEVQYVLLHRRPYLLPEPKLAAPPASDSAWASQQVVQFLVPVVVRERVLSWLSLVATRAHVFDTPTQSLILDAATAVGPVLEAAELYQSLEAHAQGLEDLVLRRTSELQVALEQAQAADQAKSQFVSNVSHELRTPLTSMRLYLDLLARGRAGKVFTYLESLTRETARLQMLIESLLLISQLDLAKVTPKVEAVNMNHLLRTLVADRMPLFASRDLDLRFEAASTPVTLQADPQLLEQVFTNLLTNALNYTPAGGKVRVFIGDATREGHAYLTVNVQDTGPGIAPEEQAHLFERFQRGQAGATVPGTGLGLAISKEIVDLHHGYLTVESDLGQGSLFTVWLPLPSSPRDHSAHIQNTVR